ncbi:cytochrome P450 [Sinorhizobium meliloti]|uniref:cytochrome P450 n=1 Tax=Rhizobium meliloti TaxID=382 RepID=UPI001297698C|nr:cytochrome P450 [Sinorhizobium meliloti]MQX93318.1 cytochrome P450 [Sinorhizobium meliloti]
MSNHNRPTRYQYRPSILFPAPWDFEAIDRSAVTGAWVVRGVSEGHQILNSKNFGLDIYDEMEADHAKVHTFMMAPPPSHLTYRRALAMAFRRNVVARMEAAILDPAACAIAEAAIRRVKAEGSAAFVEECLWPYQSTVIYRLSGLNRDAGDELVACFRLLHAASTAPSDHDPRDVLIYVHSRSADILGAARSRGNGLLPDILGTPEITALNDEEYAMMFLGFFHTLAVRLGNDLPATLLRRIASLAGVQHELRRSPALVYGAANEAVRMQDWGVIPRRVTAGCLVGSKWLCPGDNLFILLGDAGKDPRVFTEPDTFRPDRPHLNRQLAFGAGEHRCPGAYFARAMAARLALAILSRTQRITLTAWDDGAERLVLDV